MRDSVRIAEIHVFWPAELLGAIVQNRRYWPRNRPAPALGRQGLGDRDAESLPCW